LAEGKILSALEEDSLAYVQMWLQDPNAHIEDTDPAKGATAVMVCARNGSVKCMQLLIDAGCNVNATMAGGGGASALYVATQQGHRECVELLLRAGANVNAARDTGATPLYIATQQKRLDCISLVH
jgi:ankyrin repeat protein